MDSGLCHFIKKGFLAIRKMLSAEAVSLCFCYLTAGNEEGFFRGKYNYFRIYVSALLFGMVQDLPSDV